MKKKRIKYGETTIPVRKSWEDATIATWSTSSTQATQTRDFSLTLVHKAIDSAESDAHEIIYANQTNDGPKRTRRKNIKIASLDTEAFVVEWHSETPLGTIWQIQSAFTKDSQLYVLTGSTSAPSDRAKWAQIFETIVSSIAVSTHNANHTEQ